MDDPRGSLSVGSVFISYSSKDRDRVAVIASNLRKMGFEVWWDREIPVATTYHEHIKKQLDEAQAVVVVWSPASVASQYVLWEAQKAHRRGILVPAVIEEADLPPDFFLIQAADLTQWRGSTADPEWQRLTGALSRLAAGDATGPPVAPAFPARPAPVPPATKPEPAPRQPAPASSAWYSRRAGWIAIGGAGILAVVVAVAMLSGGGTDPTTTLAGGTTTLPQSTTAAPTTTTSPATTMAAPPFPELVWSRVWDEGSDVFGGSGDQKMLGLIEGGPGFVAVGEDSPSQDNVGGAVWVSEDGSVWSKVAGNADVEGVMYGIAANEDRMVAVGFLPGPGAAGVWTSTDGTTWELVPFDAAVFGGEGAPRMLAVAAADPGFVAVGEDGGSGAMWTSEDGNVWERVDQDFGRGAITCVVRGGPLGIVVGGRVESVTGDSDAAVWISTGGPWERIDSPAFGGDADQWINAMTTGGPGLVAVGGSGEGDDGDAAAVWISSDGRQWTRVDDSALGGAGLQEMFAVSSGDLGVVAVGSDAGGDWDAAVWTSSNGVAWEQVTVPTSSGDAGAFDAGQMRAVIVTESGVVGVGIMAWQTGQVIEGQPIGYGEEPDAVAWVGLPAGTE